MVRTFEEAVKITVDWWCKKSFDTPFNQNNGGDAMQVLLANYITKNERERTSDEAKIKFREELTKELLAVEGQGRYANELSVDYHPNEILSKACETSGLGTELLPIKTFTFINEENEVEGRYQYGGEWFKI